MFIISILGMFFFKRFFMEETILKNFNELSLLIIMAIILLAILMVHSDVKKDSFHILSAVLVFIFSGILFINSYSSSNYSSGQKVQENFQVKNVYFHNKDSKNTKLLVESISNKEQIILNIYDECVLAEGDIVSIKGKIDKPEANRNPKLFNYRDYLYSKYIFSILNVNNKDIFLYKKGSHSYKSSFKKHIINSLDALYRSENANFMKSVILGDPDYIENERLEKIRDLGIAHMLAVSGFHIGLLYVFLMKILSVLVNLSKRYSQIISLILIFIYIYLIGFPISAVRAFLIILALVTSQIFHKRLDSLNTVGAVGLLTLILRPLYIMSLSFQLSFLGVISVVVLSPQVETKKTSLNSILATFAGLFPISIYYFNKYSLVNIISNILVSGIFSISSLLTIINLIIFSISKSIGQLFSHLPNTTLSIMNGIITSLNPKAFFFKSPNIIVIFIMYIGIFILFRTVNIEAFPKQFLYCLFYYMIIVSTVFSITHRDRSLYVRFIDVGQGDAIWIQCNSKNYLIDAGDSKNKSGEMTLRPLLVKNGVKQIDGIIVSHFDSDHAGGVIALVDSKEIQVKKIIVGHRPDNNRIYQEIISRAEQRDVEVIHACDYAVSKKRNLAIKINRDCMLKLIPPSENIVKTNNENDSSLLAFLSAYGRSMLFTGDIELAGENELIDSLSSSDEFLETGVGNGNRVDILKVPHHGSKTSSSEELLEILKPRLSVIQCGKNSFGHPSKEIIKRYEGVESEVLRNDEDGFIEVKVNESGKPEIYRHLVRDTSLYSFLHKNREEILIVLIYIVVSVLIFEIIKDHFEIGELGRNRNS